MGGSRYAAVVLALVAFAGVAMGAQVASGHPPCKHAGQPGCVTTTTTSQSTTTAATTTATTTTATSTTTPTTTTTTTPTSTSTQLANTSQPAVSGNAQIGATMSVSNGSWSGTVTSYAYQWDRCDSSGAACSAVAGATATTYTVGTSDGGDTLRATVTASNSSGSAVAVSTPTSAVAALTAPTNISLPAISGTTSVGSTLTAGTGTWSGSPTSYAYQWTRCDSSGSACSAVSGGSASTYTLVSADASATLRVTVMATNAAGTATASSAQSAVIQGVPAPNLSGVWWAANSPFNLPIPSTATVDPNSATWVNMLYNNSSVNSIWVNSTAWTTTVYHASSSTPVATVAIANTGKHIKIPFQPGWVGSPDSDAHIAIIDDTTGCEYEFQEFNGTQLAAHSAAVFHIGTGSGAHVADAGVTGGEMSVVGGLITPGDVRSGSIDHALRMETPVNSSSYRLPATRSDGSLSGGIPEGALIRLDPTLDLTAYNLSPFELMLARALQRYGAYDDDNGGALAVYAESTSDGSSYSQPIGGLPKALVLKLQVLAPLYSSVALDSNTSTDCSNPY